MNFVVKYVLRLSSGLFSKALHLFSLGYPATGNDDNLVFFVKRYNLSNTVGGTGMVDVAGKERKGKSVKKYTQGLEGLQ